MKLISLVAKNFKKLSDFRCDFQDGLNIIVGENAQGKSTLLQAIEAALFGVTVVPGKKENIPTWGQNNFSLELHFHAAPANYILTRNKATAKLMRYDFNTDGEELVANGNTPVTAYIEQMLGLTAKDFNLFVQSKQGETAGVLTFGATALNQKVEEFAGVSLIDAVQGKAQSRASTAKARADAFSVEGGEMSAAAQALHDATEHYDLKYEEHQNAGNASDSQPRLTAVEPLVSSEELSRAQRVAQRAQSALREAEAALAHAEESFAVADAALKAADAPLVVADLEAVAAKQRAELRTVKTELSESQTTWADALQVSRELKQARIELAASPEPSEQALSSAAQACQAHAALLSEKSNALAVMKSQLDTFTKLAGDATCPTCGTALVEHDPAVLAAEIETLTAAIAAARVDLKTTTDDKSTAEHQAALAGQVSSRAVLASKVSGLLTKRVSDEDIEDLAQRSQALTDEVEALSQSVAVTVTQLDSAEQINTRHSNATKALAQATGKKLTAAVAAVEAAKAASTVAPTDVEIDTAAQAEATYRAETSAWTVEKTRLAHALELAQGSLTSATALLASAKSTVAKLESQVLECRGYAAEAALATRLAKFLRDRRQAYLAEVWDVVMAASSRQVVTASGGMISRIAYDNGEFQFEEEGVLAPVASASGAQKAHIGTAVRIGLARALYGSNSLLILDEPTEAMSERHATGLSASLVGAAKQTLLITHREQDQGLAANIIQVGE